MSSAEFDIFSAYECARNDSAQRRFINVLDMVRQTVFETAAAASMDITPFPSAKLYVAAISSLLSHRLSANDTDGLPELLRLYHVALASGSVSSSVAHDILALLLPTYTGASADLLTFLAPVTAKLAMVTTITDAQQKELVAVLCNTALHDSSRVRNAASKAIYDCTPYHSRFTSYLFENASKHPLRAFSVLKNLIYDSKHSSWMKHLDTVIEYAESSNRTVRQKALEMLSFAVAKLPADTVMQILKKYTTANSSSTGELVIAVAELTQACIVSLNKSAPQMFAEQYPDILHAELLLMLSTEEEAVKILTNSVLYSIHAIAKYAGITEIFLPITAELTAALAIQYMSIWKHVYFILNSLPAIFKDRTYDFLDQAIISSIEKITAAGTFDSSIFIYFVAGCITEMGLEEFFRRSELPLDDPVLFESTILPILFAYKPKPRVEDLEFTQANLLPIEEAMYSNLAPDPSKIMFFQLWNALVNCVATQQPCPVFLDLCCMRFEEFPELRRPICKIFTRLSRQCAEVDQVLISMLNAASDPQVSGFLIPAISAVISRYPQDTVNGFFFNLLQEKVIPFSKDDSMHNVVCSLLDVAMAIVPFASDDYRDVLYKMLIQFASDRSKLQKKALRSIRAFLDNFHMPDGIDPLLEVLRASNNKVSSSANRYRLLLVSTILHQTDDPELNGALLSEFLPEFVSATKDSGAKTRAIAIESIESIAKDFVASNGSILVLLQAIATGLDATDSTLTSGTIDCIEMLLAKYYETVPNEELTKLCLVIWKSTDAVPTSEVARSGLKFCRLLIKRIPDFGRSELGNILLFSINCHKRSNWEIRDLGYKTIIKCIGQWGADAVAECFPQREERLLRNARKEYNRISKKKDTTGEQTHKAKEPELDGRFDADALDLMDPSHTITRKPKVAEPEDVAYDEDGRILLQDVPRKKKEVTEEGGINEVNMQLHNRRDRQRKEQKASFVAESGKRFKASSGHGDQMTKNGEVPYAYAPITSKTINKRYRTQVKASYKKLFQH